jgi:hypothetical protein
MRAYLSNRYTLYTPKIKKMAKKVKQCSNCAFWRGDNKDKNLCSAISVGTDVFISGVYLMTGANFGCIKYKDKEVNDDSISGSDASDSIDN